VIGPATRAALEVPLTWRTRQIELAMERLRWLPPLGATRVALVNVPTFELWAWDAGGLDRHPVLTTRVIAGRPRTQTPILSADMRSVIVRPAWNVPRSILMNELLPALRTDPGYLARHDMEIVSAATGRSVLSSADSLELLRQGRLRIVQRPGSRNALGLLKFLFPNEHDVYMHDTPARELFGRSRRDFSHGCVRVEDPVGLAEWVLEDQPAWTRDRILAAIESGNSREIPITRPVRVVLFYLTAVAAAENSGIRFAEDFYGHDRRLHEALTAMRRPGTGIAGPLAGQ
jgi:murein L,D-transpeptidase YcbB/YkuD